MPAAKKEEAKPVKRVVRFRESFYDNKYGIFERGEAYEIPADVTLPSRDIEYIEGAPSDKAEMGELEEDEKPLRKPDPDKVAKNRK